MFAVLDTRCLSLAAEYETRGAYHGLLNTGLGSMFIETSCSSQQDQTDRNSKAPTTSSPCTLVLPRCPPIPFFELVQDNGTLTERPKDLQVQGLGP